MSSIRPARCRGRLLRTVVAPAITLAWAALAAAAPPTARPNVVVMLVDDMGVMDTSVPFLVDDSGRPRRYPLNDFYRTPAMERLADRGIRFSTFYAMNVCSPSRISLITGQNAARHRTTNWIDWRRDNAGPLGPPEWNWRGLDADDVTLPRLLQNAGYRTIHVGKGHFGIRGSPGEDPRNLGFDVNVAGTCIGQPSSHYGIENFAGPEKDVRSVNAVPGLEKYHGHDVFLTEALTLEAKAHVTAAVRDGTPFFLYFAHYAVHAPFDTDARFADHYAGSGKPDQARAFATLVEGVDKSLGDLLDHLEALGVAEETLVILLGDNGSDAPLGHRHAVACAAPLRGKKGTHYEGGMRVPFIAAWAKPAADHAMQALLPIAAGSIQRQFAAVYDIFPTLLRLADIASPSDHAIDGRRLDTLLSGTSDPGHPRQFLMHYPHSPHQSNYFTVWRDGDWKLIYHYFPGEDSGGSRYQVFNLRDDPFEQHDLAGSDPATLRRLMQGLVAACELQSALYPIDPVTMTAQPPVIP